MKPLKPIYKILYYIIYYSLAWAVRLLYPLKIIGKENLPKGGYVLAPSHIKAIDALYVILARGYKPKMLIMAKEELFKKSGLLNFIWNAFGAFPVERGAGNHSLLDEVTQEVKKGRDLLIFPEGTRSKDGQLMRVKSGAFVVAQSAGAPIVPCRMFYSAGKVKLFCPIYVAFGKPLTMQELGLADGHSPKELRCAKEQYVNALQALSLQIGKKTGA